MNEHSIAASAGRLAPVAENVWVVDDEPINAAGLHLPIRMTIIRLRNGDLILHSPIRHSPELQARVERLGAVKYLLAPSTGHWMFIPQWRRAAPDAIVVAVPGLGARRQVREAGLSVDMELYTGPPEAWAEEIETVLLSGAFFSEVALFHKPSRTLVLTDLVENIPPQDLPLASRIAANLLGITAPAGRAPLYLRGLMHLGGRGAEAAAARLIAFAPERVIFAHGDWFETNAAERLRRSLAWLTGEPRTDAMSGKRVVITGASSGIGRAAAVAFARRGASVILAARREPLLQQLAEECEALGGRALAVPTDVTDADAMKRLAERAQAEFGGVDVWINNAGTGVFGPYQDAEIALHRRTVEVNLIGTMNGAFAALPLFLRQGRGVLINNISLGGWAPNPYAAAYTATKFGLRGFTASLRQELADHPDIHVCGVFPAMIDTPGFVHGANMSGHNLDPGPWLYQPEDVAETFVRLVHAPRDETAVGWPARAGQIFYAAAPALTERVTGAVVRYLLSRANPAETRKGTMLATAPVGATASGGWLARKGLPPAGQIGKLAAYAGIAALALGTAAYLGRARNRRA